MRIKGVFYKVFIALLLTLTPGAYKAQAPPSCASGTPRCFSDLTPYAGHGPASSLPSSLCNTCSGDTRRVIVVRISSSWGTVYDPLASKLEPFAWFQEKHEISTSKNLDQYSHGWQPPRNVTDLNFNKEPFGIIIFLMLGAPTARPHRAESADRIQRASRD